MLAWLIFKTDLLQHLNLLDMKFVHINISLKCSFQRAIDKLSRHHIRHIKAYDPHEGKVGQQHKNHND